MSFALRALDADAVRKLAPTALVIEWVREAMLATSCGEVALPLRRKMDLPGDRGGIGMMPGYVGSIGRAGVKLTSLVPEHCRKGSSHVGLLILYDGDGLLPIALLDAGTVTALRTAAASAVATRSLARKDASRLTILGSGEQAEVHLEALLHVRDFSEVRIWSRSPDRVKQFVDRHSDRHAVPLKACPTVAEAVANADVICTTTSATQPFLDQGMVAAGCHVNLVGSSFASAQEATAELVPASRFFVDFRPSAFEQAGELLQAIERGLVTREDVAGEIGEVLAGRVEGRQNDRQITVYKSLGTASQDIVTADHILKRAEAASEGTILTFKE